MDTKIRFYCPGCCEPVSAASTFAGGKAKCKFCGQVIPIPAFSTRRSHDVSPTPAPPPPKVIAAPPPEGPGLWSQPGVRAALSAERSPLATSPDSPAPSETSDRPAMDQRTTEAWKEVFRGRPDPAPRNPAQARP